MVTAVVDVGSSSSSSSSSFEAVICLEEVATLLVVETLLFFFFLGVTHLTVVTSGSIVILSEEVNHPLLKNFLTKVNCEKI